MPWAHLSEVCHSQLLRRKASYSASNGGCVEVADHSNRVLVRDTQDRTGPVLRFSPAARRVFADPVKRSLTPGPVRVGRCQLGAFPGLGVPLRRVPCATESLTRDGIPSPSGHDPGRDGRRGGVAGNRFAVRAILINPRYQVWNTQR